MSVRRIWSLLLPAFLILCAELMLSCGGGGGGAVIGPPAPGPSLESISVCLGPPATATPTPTGKPVPTVAPTPCPTGIPTAAMRGGTIAFHALGRFSNGALRDITEPATTLWSSQPPPPSVVEVTGQGSFFAANEGCVCVTASSGGLSGNMVGITVFLPSSTPTPACTPCPTPVPKSAAPHAAIEGEQAQPGAHSQGVLQWMFDAGAAIRAPIAVGGAPGYESVYFVTADGVLHAIGRGGRERWRAHARAIAPALGPGGTLYITIDDGALRALSPDGAMRWRFAEASGTTASQAAVDLLAVARDGTVFCASSGAILAVAPYGALKWRIDVGEVAQAAPMPDGGVIAAVGHATVVAFAADGVERWRFAPDGGIAGKIAVTEDRIYVGGADGVVHALSVDGAELTRIPVDGALVAGPVADSKGDLGFLTDSVHIISSDDASERQLALGKREEVRLLVMPGGQVVVAAGDGRIDILERDGPDGWSAKLSSGVTAIAAGSDGTLYVATASGRLYAIR
jgi:outer membrane protein assembly factor BamB